MDDASAPDESLRYLRALGDPDRLRIVQFLRGGPRSVSEVCRELDSPMPNVSHHLSALKEVGIVTAHRRGRHMIYQLDEHVVSGPALEFGCCRIEFGESRGGETSEAQALAMLNRILGRTREAGPAPEPSLPSDSARQISGRRIQIENASFESPSTPFYDTAVAGWQKEGDPSRTGVFRNFPDDTPIPGSRFIADADGEQLATIGARRGLGLFQLLATSVYEAGATYTLRAGVGVSSVQPPIADGGVPPRIRMSLTHTDDAGRRHELAARSVAPAELDPARLTYLTLKASTSPACVGKSIGICFSTAENTAGHDGHFIVDNVALFVEIAEDKATGCN